MRFPKLQLFSALTIALATTGLGEDLFEQMENRAKTLSPALASVCVSLKAENGLWGSGVIVSKEGIVFTAAHTFSGDTSEKISVYRNGMPSTTAKLVRFNRTRDIAILQIKDFSSTDIATVNLSSISTEGRPYLAAGHATGFDSSRIAPVRFGFGYRVANSNQIMTTCRVNVGDSGGPLFDLNGKLVAIHRTMDARGKYAAHVPVAQFFEIWPELEDNRSIATVDGTVLVAQK